MVSLALSLTTRRNHITQKVKIAEERTHCLSVQDDEYPTEMFWHQLGTKRERRLD